MLWLLMADEFVLVPAREARAVMVPSGGRFRVVDVEGGQVCDLFAFVAGDVGEYASAEHTRIWVNRLFPRAGEAGDGRARPPAGRGAAADQPVHVGAGRAGRLLHLGPGAHRPRLARRDLDGQLDPPAAMCYN
jgi:Domain of unknown function (DUF1989)